MEAAVISDRAAAHYAQIRAKYTVADQASILRLYSLVLRHQGTSGGNCCAKLLLGLYNGRRFPFDLTDLRLLDVGNFADAIHVITMDATRTYCEVHELLDAMFADGISTGDELENWAFNLRLKGRCKKEHLAPHRSRSTSKIETLTYDLQAVS